MQYELQLMDVRTKVLSFSIDDITLQDREGYLIAFTDPPRAGCFMLLRFRRSRPS
jgi:hypothetical protein